MAQRDNFTDIAGGEAIFQPAINPDMPTQTGPFLLKWRGIWTPGVLYNKNDLAKVPAVGENSATLEIALETHVASLAFIDDEGLWGRVLDASELQNVTGLPPEELQAFVDQAKAAAAQSANAANVSAGHADRARATADSMQDNINTALDQIDAGVGTVEIIQEDVTASATAASDASDQAKRFASADVGVIVDPITGAESTRAAVLRARTLLISTALTPYLYVDDPLSGSGTFDIVPDATWFGRKVLIRASRNNRIVLPANLNRTPWAADGSDAAAFFRLKRVGTGTTAVVGGSAAVVTPDFIIDDYYSVRQAAPTTTSTFTRTITVPPGTGRYLVFESFELYNVADTARAATVTAQIHGGAAFTMAKQQGPLSTNQYNITTGSQAAGNLWVGTIPDSPTAAQVIDVTSVFARGLFLFAQYLFVAGPAAGFNATTVGYSDAANQGNFADINLTVAAGKANSLAVLGFTQRQAQIPTSMVPGTIRNSGLMAGPTPDPNAGLNSSVIFGYQKNLGVGATSWRGTWPSGARHAAVGILIEPGAAATGILIRTSLTLTALAANQEILVEALNDGTTYDIS